MNTSLWTRLKSAMKKLAIMLSLSTVLVVILDCFILRLDWVLDPGSLNGAQRNTANYKFCKAGMFKSIDDPLRHFGLTPSMDISVDDCRYYHNSRGLRDDEVTDEKPEGEYRILMIGDSYTYGWGVDQKDTIPAKLEDRLRETPESRDIRVINCGVPAYDTAAEFGFLEQVGEGLQPDAIILVFQVNDVTQVDHFYLDDRQGFYACDLPFSFRAKKALDHSPIYHLVRKANEGIKTKLGFEWFGEKEWPRTERYLRKFIEGCQSRGLPLLVVNLPHFQVGTSDKFLYSYREENPNFSIQNDWVREVVESSKVPCIDILAVLQERVSIQRKPVELLYVRLAELDDPAQDEDGNPQYKQLPDHHLNKMGCNLVADEIAKTIESEGWIPGL